MNPIEYTEAIQKMQVNNILNDGKDSYTKEEVIKIIQEVASQQKKAIFNGEFIFDVDFINEEKVTIEDEDYSIKKMLLDGDKYIIFLQTENEDVEPLRRSVPDILKLSSNILGVFIISSKADVNLITAKLQERYNYSESEYAITNEEMKTFKEFSFSQSFVDKLYSTMDSFGEYITYKKPTNIKFTTSSTSNGDYYV